ncbi:MAG: hypothetical protein ABII71_01840 [Candidatus Micrarchaeota archaeon]
MAGSERTLINRTIGEEKRDGRWLNKAEAFLSDKFRDASFGMKKAAIYVIAPVMLATGAGCGAQSRSLDDAATPDAATDSGPDAEADSEPDTEVADGDADIDSDIEADGDADSDVDGDADAELDGDVEEDADTTADGDVDADAEGELDGDTEDDGDVEAPPEPLIANLVGDFLNRRAGDRTENVAGEVDAEYPLGGSHTSANANPFTDGSGGSLGPSEVFLHRIDGTMTPLLADVTLMDMSTGDMYLEEQTIWVRGNSHFDWVYDDVVGEVNFISYTIRLARSMGLGTHGIPVCTASESGTDFTDCLERGDRWDQATAGHRLTVQLPGSEWSWVVIGMEAPSATEAPLDNDTTLVNGGRITLATEAVSGIVMEGGSLPYTHPSGDTYSFYVETIGRVGMDYVAIIEIQDSAGVPIVMEMMSAGDTPPVFSIDGAEVPFYIYYLAPGATPATRWIDCAILGSMLVLEDGRELNAAEDDNDAWNVALGWSNIDGSAADPQADSLAVISIYSDDIEDISSSGEAELLPGDELSILSNPEAWNIVYEGMDVASDELHPLELEVERNASRSIPASSGPTDSTGAQVACDVTAPYITVSVDSYGLFVVREVLGGGDASDNELIVATSGGSCGGTIGPLSEGAILLHESPASGDYALRQYGSPGHMVEFDLAGGDATWESGGVIEIAAFADADASSGSSRIANEGYIYSSLFPFAGPLPDFVIGLSEDAGPEYSEHTDRFFIPFWIAGPASTFTMELHDSMWRELAAFDGLPMQHAGPVTGGDGSFRVEDVGYTTERGSVFTSMTDTTLEIQIAERVVFTTYTLVPSWL